MRISDWSSDVCSSDLLYVGGAPGGRADGTPEGVWVQGEMLRRGMARVYTFADNRALVAEMLALEREARAARRGIWGHPFYAVRRHDALDRHIGTFQLVEGRSEEHTSELQSLMRISYAVFC